MKEELLCEGCSHLNHVEISEEYYTHEQENHFDTFVCEECRKINGISWKMEHRIYAVDIEPSEEEIEQHKGEEPTIIIHRPQCPSCGEPMLFSMCIAYNEYVCVPCGKYVQYLNDYPRLETTQEKEDAEKIKYCDDLKRLAFTMGGAMCNDCNQDGGNNCPTCQLPAELKYWEKRV